MPDNTEETADDMPSDVPCLEKLDSPSGNIWVIPSSGPGR